MEKKKMPENSIMKKSNIRRNAVCSIALILMLTLPAMLICIPTASAAGRTETYCFVYVEPDPIGIGQYVIVTYRIDKLSPTAAGTSGGYHFTGFSVDITDPENKTTTKTGLTTDSTSTGYFIYYPTKVGTYKFQAHFPAQNVSTSQFVASDSEITEITVQADKIATIPDNPLPTGYWTRPVYGENKGWYRVADDWLWQGYDRMARSFGSASSAVGKYTPAPNSAHILWTLPILPGGIVGGPFGDQIYYEGLSYEQHYNPIIWNGRIIFSEHDLATTTIYQTRCISLYTGEDIWILPNITILCAQVQMTSNPNEHGGVPYLISSGTNGSKTVLTYYDAWTGRKAFTLTNITWGGAGGYNLQTRPGPNGEILSYYLSGKTLNLWNSTKAIIAPASFETWGPSGTIDGGKGLQWSVSVPDLLSGMAIWDVAEGYVLLYKTNSTVTPNIYTHQAIDISSMKKDSNGNYPTTLPVLFTKDRYDIWESYFLMTNIGSGVYGMFDESLCQYHVWSIKTGEELWVSEPITDAWASFDWEWWICYGILYASGYDGYVRAYNATTGEVLWKFFMGSAGYENAYGTYPVYSGFNFADGKIFVTNDEHSPDAVPWRGGKLWCFDAYNGTLIWSISGKLRMGAIADGIYTSLNSLDGQIYTFGKGPSATTVSAPQAAVVKGSPVMITGTVTDQSPGQKDTPAISDANMTVWMEYLHEQAQMPTNAIGVPVKITYYDPNGNSQTLGTAISDDSGNFGIAFTPTLEGSYQFRATFEGTNSYGSSYATAYMVVGAATTATAAPTATPSPTATPTPTATPSPTVSPSPVPDTGATNNTALYVGIAAVVIIVAIAAVAVILRRRK
jgi:hypothetical protein